MRLSALWSSSPPHKARPKTRDLRDDLTPATTCISLPYPPPRSAARTLRICIATQMVEVYGLPYPAPCGDSECCGAKYQMCCCQPCTVCLIARELKARGVAPGQVAATGASATVGVPVAAGAPAEVMER